MREINLIVIHCSATKPQQDIGVAEIRQWHKAKGWHDVGYHYVIRRNGEVQTGRHEYTVGAHAKGHNQRSIGVCLIGGINDNGKPAANFTRQQWDSLASLTDELKQRYPAHVVGHCDLAKGKKACPCFDVKSWSNES